MNKLNSDLIDQLKTALHAYDTEITQHHSSSPDHTVAYIKIAKNGKHWSYCGVWDDTLTIPIDAKEFGS